MKDERVRPSARVHTAKGWKTVTAKGKADYQKMEGQTIEAGGEFDLGNGVKAKAPGNSGSAGNDINCRCFLEYRMMSVEEFAEATGKSVAEVKKENGVAKSGESGIIKVGTSVNQRNTGKGNPNAILQFDVDLNNRQNELLKKLDKYDSKTVVHKSNVNMKDLAALTAKTGDEFAMLSNGHTRMIVRGNSISVNIDVEEAQKLKKQGYRFSGHTHPGVDELCLIASEGDIEITKVFNQTQGVVYNSKGQFRTYDVY